VRIVGCTIERYVPPVQMGAILAGGHAASDGTSGWIVDSTEVRYNANLGIRLGHAMKVRWSNVHHNGTLGIGGVGDDVLVEQTEIAYNNYANAGALGFEAGATKFVLTNRLLLRNNFVHHNVGPGLWLDIGNDATVIEGNRVEDNLQEGIVAEISYRATIRNNTVRRNGLGDSRRTAWLWGAGIGIHASGGASLEVSGNLLEGNAHGIALLQQNRGTGPLGAYLVQNVYVHDNTVRCGSGSLTVAGAVQDIGDNSIFTSRNNRFQGNHYENLAQCSGRPFAWMNGWWTPTEWPGYGQDTSGTFVR
jgi:parallel beta-helix repeat protein